jgi:putative endonuclease
MKSDSWFVYIVKCSDGTLYCGATNDLEKRIEKHNSGKGAKYTRTRVPVVIVFSETALNKSAAFKRECAIKKMSRTRKLELIKGHAGDFLESVM